MLSIGGSWGVFYLMSNWDDIDTNNGLPPESTGFYRVTDWLGMRSLYWLFSVFTIPFMTWTMEMCFYGIRFFFAPSTEMGMREAEKKELFDGEERVVDVIRGWLGLPQLLVEKGEMGKGKQKEKEDIRTEKEAQAGMEMVAP